MYQLTLNGSRDKSLVVNLYTNFRCLQYYNTWLLKVVIRSRIFSPVARQPASTWQAVCTQIVARGLKYYHPSMKRIRSPSTECRSPLWMIWMSANSDSCPIRVSLFCTPQRCAHTRIVYRRGVARQFGLGGFLNFRTQSRNGQSLRDTVSFLCRYNHDTVVFRSPELQLINGRGSIG